jgi:hypothetical protein
VQATIRPARYIFKKAIGRIIASGFLLLSMKGEITLKELVCIVAFNVEGYIVSIEPKNKTKDKKVAYCSLMSAKLLTPEEVDKGIREVRGYMKKGELDIKKCKG